MGACFGLVAVREPDEILKEFYRAHKCGLSYTDWRQMTRWQVLSLVLQDRMEAHQRRQSLRGRGWKGIISALVARVMGL